MIYKERGWTERKSDTRGRMVSMDQLSAGANLASSAL